MSDTRKDYDQDYGLGPFKSPLRWSSGRVKAAAAVWAMFIAALIMAPTANAAAAQPAGIVCDITLGTVCGHVYHLNAGMSKPIPVKCHNGSKHYVSKGHRDPCGDMDKIYVYSGAELWCQYGTIGGYFMEKVFDATGWHGVSDNFDKNCDFHRD